jgi:hypothetical protein
MRGIVPVAIAGIAHQRLQQAVETESVVALVRTSAHL